MKYEVFRGRVSGVKKASVAENIDKYLGGGSIVEFFIPSRQTFTIDDKEIFMPSPRRLEDGDEVVIAGHWKGDCFQVVSCKNFTRNWIWGRGRSKLIWVILALVFPTILTGGFLFATLFSMLFSKEALALPLIFVFVATFYFPIFHRIHSFSKAYKQLEKIDSKIE